MSGFYLGIDQSTSGTGVCLMAPNRAAYETIVIKEAAVKKLRGGQRLKYIQDRVLEFLDIKLHGNLRVIRQAAMEGYAYNIVNAGKQIYGNPFQLGEVGGTIKLLFETAYLPYVVVNPMDVKRWVKGTTGGSKDVVMSYLTHEFGVLFDDNNAADAYALACIAMDYAGDWNSPAPNARIRDGRAKAIQEIRVDPHAVLMKKSKDKIRQAMEMEI